MACISPDGKPTASGGRMLAALKGGPCSAEEVSKSSGLPLFRVRSGLRELEQAGLTSAKGDKYELSPEGRKLADSL